MEVRLQPFLFSYCLCIGGREFFIQVTESGTIHWDDYQERRRVSSRLPHLAPGAMKDEFTVSLPLEPSLAEEFQRAALLFEKGQWTVAHEHQLDEVLVPLFWSQVNARLAHPLPESDRVLPD